MRYEDVVQAIDMRVEGCKNMSGMWAKYAGEEVKIVGEMGEEGGIV